MATAGIDVVGVDYIEAANSARETVVRPLRSARRAICLPLAQRQAGWSRLQMAYLTVADEEARRLMQEVPE